MDRDPWDFSRTGDKPRRGLQLTKAINARFALEDWKLIQRAAASDGITMSRWLMETAEPSLRELRRKAQADT